MTLFFQGIYGVNVMYLIDTISTSFGFADMASQVSHLLVAVIGMGSACFHCTLRHVEQQCDETPMVLSQLNWFLELFSDTWEESAFVSAAMPVLLFLYGLVSFFGIPFGSCLGVK